MHYAVVVHDSGNGKPSAEVFLRKLEAREAFKKSKGKGSLFLFELRRAQASKRRNSEIAHTESESSLVHQSDEQLRSAARKRKISFADNPTITRDRLIGAIQQHDLNKRLTRSGAEAAAEIAARAAAAKPSAKAKAKAAAEARAAQEAQAKAEAEVAAAKEAAAAAEAEARAKEAAANQP